MNDDTISRQDAIDALAEYVHNVDKVMGTGRLSWDDCKDSAISVLEDVPSAQPEQIKMIKEIRKWINSGNRGNADYFIVDKIEEIINKYE